MSLKKHIQENFDHLGKMTVREYLTYRKWEQLNMLKFSPGEQVRLSQLKRSLWYPNEPDDYLKIKPDLVFADNKADVKTWMTLRNFIHAQVYNQNVGRTMRCFVIDRNSGRYLGVLALASDFVVIGPREKYIGWTADNRTKDKRLNFTAMAQTICPTQPFGFNYTGGKLMALLCCSDKFVNKWNEKYKKQALIGITTTSLFGRPSQYTRLKYWHDCGDTAGEQFLEPSEHIYQAMKEWMKKRYKKEYDGFVGANGGKVVSRPKTRITRFVLSRLGVRAPKNNAPRGVYFCLLYKDGREFLRMEKQKILAKPLFDNRLDVLFDMWKERYAKNRIKNTKDRIGGHLFYDDMIGTTWMETREKYIKS